MINEAEGPVRRGFITSNYNLKSNHDLKRRYRDIIPPSRLSTVKLSRSKFSKYLAVSNTVRNLFSDINKSFGMFQHSIHHSQQNSLDR